MKCLFCLIKGIQNASKKTLSKNKAWTKVIPTSDRPLLYPCGQMETMSKHIEMSRVDKVVSYQTCRSAELESELGMESEFLSEAGALSQIEALQQELASLPMTKI